MRIAVTQRVVHNLSYEDDRDALSQDWVPFLETALPGCVVIPVPNALGDCKGWMDAVNPGAVVLSNGNDLDSEVLRDQCELQVMRWAVEREIPLLGVCRGLQFINRYFGGDLTIGLGQTAGLNHVGCEHDIIVSHTGFSSLVRGNPMVMRVNSYHGHGVRADDLAPVLTAFSTAADGTIEGLVHDEKPVLAMQWHPERPGTDQLLAEIMVHKFFTEGRFW